MIMIEQRTSEALVWAIKNKIIVLSVVLIVALGGLLVGGLVNISENQSAQPEAKIGCKTTVIY